MSDSKEYDNAWYRRKSATWKQQKMRRQRARCHRIRLWLDGLKAETGCACGERDVRCLDFDHVRGEKRFNIANGPGHGMSEATILREIAKCDLLCANCHRKKTFRRTIR